MRKFFLIVISLIFVFISGCKLQEETPTEIGKVSEKSTLNSNYVLSNYQIGIYDIYLKDIGVCAALITHRIYVDDIKVYTYTSEGCEEDPLFYIKHNNEFYTLNEAVDEAYITDDQIKSDLFEDILIS